MNRMEYTGNIPELQGKTALVKPDLPHPLYKDLPNPDKYVTAQFDDMTPLFGGVKMWAGWHAFLKADFTPLGDKPVF